MTYRVAFIGTGSRRDDPGRDGYAMAYRHASGYRRLSDCELVACADLVPENAMQFAAEFDIDDANVYESYERMLAAAEPDVVSVCVPPAAHADIVNGCAESGVPMAIHCEKPMARTWAECREMVAACDSAGVRLTFNHQMRFGAPFARAKELLDAGAIGDPRRVEFTEANLYDAGVHLFDVCDYFLDGASAEWVLAALDYSEENVWFGAHNENQAIAQWRYENGVCGIAATGRNCVLGGEYLRIHGDDGEIVIRESDTPLRVRSDGGWRSIDTGVDNVYGPEPGVPRRAARTIAERLPLLGSDRFTRPTYTERAVANVVAALREGHESGLAGSHALRGTELVFACWESVRRRGRVDLPLQIDDNPLEAMVEDGSLGLGND